MAGISSTSINRPILTTVMSVAIILFGYIGFSYLGVREFPSVDPPIITVSASYPGANADVMESQVTEPLEESINGIDGIRTISSVSAEGRSTITVEFGLNVNLDNAANDVRDRVSRIVSRLPPDMDPPQVAKADANAQAVMIISVVSPSLTQLELSFLASEVFKERLQTIQGVSSIQIYGEKRYSMRLWLDPAKLAAYRLTPLDVQQAIQRENVELPSGKIEGNTVELSVRTLGRLTDPDAFNRLVVRQVGDEVVRLEDVGYAKLDAENLTTSFRRDGQPAVAVAIIPQPGANNIEISRLGYERLKQIERDLPKGVTYFVTFDATKYINLAIEEVIETLYIAFALVVLVIFLFLRDWRSTLIPVLAIPVSLVGAFFIMYLLDYSINVLTLLAIVLSIGLVVDDAIVVLENIYAKIEEGMSPMEAGRKGTEEIYVAVIATTIVLAAVFLPIIFLQGLVGRLFREFGVVVAGAVGISAFVALTLTPMLSTRLLKHRTVQPWFYRKTEPFFEKMVAGYRSSLEAFMQRRWLAWPIMLVCGFLIVFLFGLIPSELSPQEDRSNFRVFATAPEGTSYDFMDRYVVDLTQMLQDSVPEIQTMITVTAPGFGSASAKNSAFANLILKDPDQRLRTQQAIAAKLQPSLAQMSGARAYIVQPVTIGSGGRGLPIQYVIQANNFDSLAAILPRFMDEARQNPAFSFVDLDLKFNKPELQVDIDRAKARSLNVSVIDIARTLQLSLSEARYGFFIRDGKQYQIIGQLERQNRNEPLDLSSMYVRSQDGRLIQLDNLVRLREKASPPQLYRFNRFVSATVSANPAPGYTLGDGIKAMDEIKARILPDGFQTDLAGASRDFSESSNSLLFAFLLALIMIYLVLAAQFESIRDPFVILFTVPLALAGALFFLWYYQQTLNIFSQIGIIMLIGLVTKNGILIVEFANQRKEVGRKRAEAAVDAAVSRFRPILMTSLATALGFLPIALALGAGAESRVGMGIVVVGGVIFSTILTLYVIPAIYSYLSKETTPHVSGGNGHAPHTAPASVSTPTEYHTV